MSSLDTGPRSKDLEAWVDRCNAAEEKDREARDGLKAILGLQPAVAVGGFRSEQIVRWAEHA